jgi:hypothetical protein
MLMLTPLHRSARARARRQCTDLDGTLIEDQADDNEWVRAADASTRQAASYFGTYLAPAGGVLVFNTGRSIGLVEGLLRKKAGIMPRVRSGWVCVCVWVCVLGEGRMGAAGACWQRHDAGDGGTPAVHVGACA